MQPAVRGDSIGDAYQQALTQYFEGYSPYLVVESTTPVQEAQDVDSLDIADWRESLHLGEEYWTFREFDFHHESPLVGGTTGEDWLNDRLVELYEGMYKTRLEDPDQLGMIEHRLQYGSHGSCTNALVAQVFRDDDLERACVHRPNNGGMACMTQLQFHPVEDRLNLYMVLRTQYLDLKGYGNLVAAATLLSRMCARTGYRPGFLVEYVNNPITYSHNLATQLHRELIHETSFLTGGMATVG